MPVFRVVYFILQLCNLKLYIQYTHFTLFLKTNLDFSFAFFIHSGTSSIDLFVYKLLVITEITTLPTMVLLKRAFSF